MSLQLEAKYGLSVVIDPAISGFLCSEKAFSNLFPVVGGTFFVLPVIMIAVKLLTPSAGYDAEPPVWLN